MPSRPLSPAPAKRASDSTHKRLPIVDIARGVAIIQMIAYHFCYDLNYFAWIHVALTRDAPWIAWRTAIVTQFVFLVGVSLNLRATNENRRPWADARFWVRWGQIAGCACLVSLTSWWLFGPRFIWFGVLHFVALAQLLLLGSARLGWASVICGVLIVAAGAALRITLFDSNAVSWIGFAPTKPSTEDFVPVFPWLGVVLLGVGAARLWQQSDARWAQALRGVRSDGWRWAGLLGRWPLTVYMLHQPVLFGLLYTVHALLQAPG
ncbi:MAG TPA: heparan-alpha-glucosaminide N-acetyltransferase [Burkholderiaceae bacterium]|nr:heparan-alpha-glucosaminide N-acetyltransferase [Burkholderiaceae bacterium]